MLSDDLISVKDIQDRIGAGHPASVHSLAKKLNLKKVKKGGRTYFDREEFERKYESHLANRGQREVRTKRRVGGGQDVIVDEIFKPFEARPEFIAWNKGKWRGWCFAAVEDVSKLLVALITNENKRYDWMPAQVAKDIADGKAFVMMPETVLRFIALQMLHVKDRPGIADLIKLTLALADRFEAVRDSLAEMDFVAGEDEDLSDPDEEATE